MASESVRVASLTSTPSPTLTPSPSPVPTLQPTFDFEKDTLRWCISDTEGDVEVPYIDVLKMEAVARGEILTVKISLQSIPEFLSFNRGDIPPDRLEYAWKIEIDVDGDANADLPRYNDFTEYELSVMHFVNDDETKTASLAEGTQQSIWKRDLEHPTWENIGDGKLEVDRAAGTITIIGTIPGLNPNSKLAFGTFDYNPGYEKQEDKPDSMNMMPPNTACTRRVGVAAFSSSLRGWKLVPSKWRHLVPPTRG